jgi:hypothetical protein
MEIPKLERAYTLQKEIFLLQLSFWSLLNLCIKSMLGYSFVQYQDYLIGD